MTASVAVSQRSHRGALARGLHVDVILPIETHPKKHCSRQSGTTRGLQRSSEPPVFRHMPHWGVPLQIWDTGEARWCHRGGMRSIRRGVLRQMVCVKGHRRRCQDFPAQFLRLGSEEERYSLELSDGSGAEADASISSPPSVNNTPSLYCAERITAFSVSYASPRLAVLGFSLRSQAGAVKLVRCTASAARENLEVD